MPDMLDDLYPDQPGHPATTTAAPGDMLSTAVAGLPPTQPSQQVPQPQSLGSTVAQGAGNVFMGGSAAMHGMWEGGYDWLRRAFPGLPDLPPETRELAQAPPGAMGSIGKFIGNVLPYAAGEGLLAPVAEGVTGALESARVPGVIARALPRAATGAATSGLVTGLETGGDPNAIREAAEIGALTPAVTEGLVKPLWGPLSGWWGKLTGQGGEVLRTIASDADQNFRKAMTDPNAERKLVGGLQDAIQKVRDARGAAYNQGMGNLDQSIRLNLADTKTQLANELAGWNIGVNPNGSLDFSKSKIVGAGPQKFIRNAARDVSNWTDNSPAGMDMLKKRLFAYSNENTGNATAFFNNLGEGVDSTLDANVPGYSQLTSEYKKATGMLGEIQREVGGGRNEFGRVAKPGDAIRRLALSMSRNDEYKQMLLEAMDQAAGSHLKQDVAGYASRPWMPRVLGAGIGPAEIAGGLLLHHPSLIATGIPVTALSSPRVAANTVALISAMGRRIPTGAGTGLITGTAAQGLGQAEGGLVRNPEVDRLQREGLSRAVTLRGLGA